jgi:GR25 family glycosyltransferase involved in LPS biosynthesis
MEKRFNNLEIDCKFYSGVNCDDKRIDKSLNKFCKRQWCMTYGHLDIIRNFYYKSDKKYAVICEDDIYLHKDIKTILNKVITDFNVLHLDILLLGYLLPYKIGYEHLFVNFQLKKQMPKEVYFKYHEYPDYLNGTHMYMITKTYARHLLKSYYNNYANFDNKYFSPDKILIKDGNRALLYPMISVEDDNQYDLYHQLCHNIHYNESYV